MWRENKTKTAQLEKQEPDTSLMIVKSVPRMRTVRPRKIKVTAATNVSLLTTSETSGNRLRLCVNLMPVLASAKEPVEEEERKEGDNTWRGKKKLETNSKNDPPAVEQILRPRDSYSGLNWDSKQPQSFQCVLPPVSLPKPTAGLCVRQKTKRRHKPLPPIGLTKQTKTIASNLTMKDSEGQDPDSRPRMDHPLFSKSRSAEFHLPDISLSSLDALLQTVTQKLGRKRSRGDGGPRRRVQSDRLLVAVNGHRVRQSDGQQIGHCTDNGSPADTEAMTETSVGGWRADRQKSLPPLFSAPKPTLILTMTKRNLPTSNTLQ